MSKSFIVDKLVRAAAAVPSDIPDDELNRHVAEILAKEAKEKESKWREMGIGVYLQDKPGLVHFPLAIRYYQDLSVFHF